MKLVPVEQLVAQLALVEPPVVVLVPVERQVAQPALVLALVVLLVAELFPVEQLALELVPAEPLVLIATPSSLHPVYTSVFSSLSHTTDISPRFAYMHPFPSPPAS